MRHIGHQLLFAFARRHERPQCPRTEQVSAGDGEQYAQATREDEQDEQAVEHGLFIFDVVDRNEAHRAARYKQSSVRCAGDGEAAKHRRQAGDLRPSLQCRRQRRRFRPGQRQLSLRGIPHADEKVRDVPLLVSGKRGRVGPEVFGEPFRLDEQPAIDRRVCFAHLKGVHEDGQQRPDKREHGHVDEHKAGPLEKNQPLFCNRYPSPRTVSMFGHPSCSSLLRSRETCTSSVFSRTSAS